jgi:hypothetical protein
MSTLGNAPLGIRPLEIQPLEIQEGGKEEIKEALLFNLKVLG